MNAIKDLKYFIRNHGFAKVGCYPLALLMSDGEVIDWQSAKENYKQILWSTKHKDRDGWQAVGTFIHWEGEPLICAHSGRVIESAYGVPEDCEVTA